MRGMAPVASGGERQTCDGADETLSQGSFCRRCLGARSFLSFGVLLLGSSDPSSFPVLSCFLGINVFSSLRSFLLSKTSMHVDKQGDSSAASTTFPQSRSHKVK